MKDMEFAEKNGLFKATALFSITGGKSNCGPSF
jgi:hypothetical protein